MSSASDCIFCKIVGYNLYDSGVSLPTLPFRTIWKLHNISETPKLIKKVITNLDLSKVSRPDCILSVVLKNCEPELSYILAELFNMCMKGCCFPGCWKVSLVVHVFRNPLPLCYSPVVSKVFEKLVNDRLVDHLENFFLISSRVLGLLDQLQIFWQLHMIELVGFLIGLGLLEL